MFEESFNAAMDRYRKLLVQVDASSQPRLSNVNFDTGALTGPGQYRLNDKRPRRDSWQRLPKQDFTGAIATSPHRAPEFLQRPRRPLRYETKTKSLGQTPSPAPTTESSSPAQQRPQR